MGPARRPPPWRAFCRPECSKGASPCWAQPSRSSLAAQQADTRLAVATRSAACRRSTSQPRPPCTRFRVSAAGTPFLLPKRLKMAHGLPALPPICLMSTSRALLLPAFLPALPPCCCPCAIPPRPDFYRPDGRPLQRSNLMWMFACGPLIDGKCGASRRTVPLQSRLLTLYTTSPLVSASPRLPWDFSAS